MPSSRRTLGPYLRNLPNPYAIASADHLFEALQLLAVACGLAAAAAAAVSVTLPASVISNAARACSLVAGKQGGRRLPAWTSRKNVKTGHRRSGDR